MQLLTSDKNAHRRKRARIENLLRRFGFQVYKNRHVAEQLVRRAEQAGYTAIVLTVDAPRLGRREADIKNK